MSEGANKKMYHKKKKKSTEFKIPTHRTREETENASGEISCDNGAIPEVERQGYRLLSHQLSSLSQVSIPQRSSPRPSPKKIKK